MLGPHTIIKMCWDHARNWSIFPKTWLCCWSEGILHILSKALQKVVISPKTLISHHCNATNYSYTFYILFMFYCTFFSKTIHKATEHTAGFQIFKIIKVQVRCDWREEFRSAVINHLSPHWTWWKKPEPSKDLGGKCGQRKVAALCCSKRKQLLGFNLRRRNNQEYGVVQNE